MDTNRMSYPDIAFDYQGSMGSRYAWIEQSVVGEYAIFDGWMTQCWGFKPCVGFAKISELAPIIFREWRN